MRIQTLALAIFMAAPAAARSQQPARDSAARDSLVRADSRRDSIARDSLIRRVNHLPEVTITATPARRTEPVSAVRITGDNLSLAGASTPLEALRQAAGLEVHLQGQGPGFASDASVRGFSSDHSTDLALWIDGVPVNEPVNGHAEGYNDWSLLFPQVVRDVDVYKGPTSALFGNFALSGIVNVRTIERMKGTTVEASGGRYGRGEGTLLTGWDHGASGGGVLGARYEHDDGFRPHSEYDLTQGHARAVRSLSQAVTLDGAVDLYGARWHSPGFITTEQFDLGRFDTVANPTDGGFKRRAQERVSLRVVHGSAFWRTTLYATQSRWQLFLTTPPEGGGEEGSGGQTEEEDSRYGLGATSAVTLSFPTVDLTVGGETRFDRSDYQNWATEARVRGEAEQLVNARQLSGALFVQSVERIGSRLQLSLGGRVDALDTHASPADSGAPSSDAHAIFSPKAGAIAQVAGGLAVYANVSRGFRSFDGINGDPALPFVTAWAYESGLKLDRAHVSATASLFRMDLSSEQSFNDVTGQVETGGASRRQGVELELRAPVTRFASVIGDWTFNDARYSTFRTEEEDLSGARIFNTARYIGAATLQIAPPGARWHVHLGGNWVGPYTPFDEGRTELGAYGLVHASAYVTLGPALLSLGVRNLFDRSYPELRAGGFVSPGEPRAVYGGLRYRF